MSAANLILLARMRRCYVSPMVRARTHTRSATICRFVSLVKLSCSANTLGARFHPWMPSRPQSYIISRTRCFSASRLFLSSLLAPDGPRCVPRRLHRERSLSSIQFRSPIASGIRLLSSQSFASLNLPSETSQKMSSIHSEDEDGSQKQQQARPESEPQSALIHQNPANNEQVEGQQQRATAQARRRLHHQSLVVHRPSSVGFAPPFPAATNQQQQQRRIPTIAQLGSSLSTQAPLTNHEVYELINQRAAAAAGQQGAASMRASQPAISPLVRGGAFKEHTRESLYASRPPLAPGHRPSTPLIVGTPEFRQRFGK